MESNPPIKLIVTLVVGLILGIFVLLNLPFVMIDAGHRGVIMNYGKVQDYVFDEGIHFKTPFVQTVRAVDVRVQKNDVKAEAASRDLQDVQMDVVVNYHIDPKKVNAVYQKIGDNTEVFNRIIAPNTNEVVKAATAQYTAEDIIKKRQDLKNKIDVALLARLKDYNVILDDVSLTNIDFSAEFNAAIEAKQVAEQEAQQAKFVALKATQEALAQIERAKGSAEAQRLQQETLTSALLQKYAIDRWDGKLPQYMTADSGLLFNIPVK